MSNTNTNSSHVSFFDTKKGIMSWVWTTDHKRIGIMYLYSMLFFFLIGAVLRTSRGAK